MIQVKTIEQFHVLQYIRKCFYEEKVEVDIVDDTSLKVKDTTGNSIVFTWDGKKVIRVES